MTQQVDDYWDLLTQMAHIQGQLGEDLVAWAKTYEAGGQAMQRSSRTLQEMAELGRRMQHYLESGTPPMVTQILNMVTSPWPGIGIGMGMPPPPPTAATGPFAQLWETWASSLRPPDPGKPEPGS